LSIPSLASRLIICRRFGISWLSEAHIELQRFQDLRVEDNFEGSNDTTLVIHCRDGTEVSQYGGIQMLRIFETLQGPASTTSSPQWVTFQGGWTVLANQQSSLKINVKLERLITLKDSEGDYAITMSSDGKYLAGGSRVVEVFLADTWLRLWTLGILSGDDDEIHTAAFNKSSTQLATAGEKGIIYVSILFSSFGLSSYLIIVSKFALY
jgi:WD40 repeat protein